MAKVKKRKNEGIEKLISRFNKQLQKEEVSKIYDRLYKNNRKTSETMEIIKALKGMKLND